MSIFDLPPINATLNGIGAGLIILVTLTLIPVLRSRFDWDGKMGKFRMPIWRYVSVTAVIDYFMLYQWLPSTHFDELKKRYQLEMRARFAI